MQLEKARQENERAFKAQGEKAELEAQMEEVCRFGGLKLFTHERDMSLRQLTRIVDVLQKEKVRVGEQVQQV